MLVNGVGVEYRGSEGRIRGDQVQVIDFDNPTNNDWLAVNQFSITENRNNRRPDVVLFVNGLPLGIIELKSLRTRTPQSRRPAGNSRPTRPSYPPSSP